MAQTRNDNLDIRAPKHIDNRTANLGEPYASISEANASIIYRVKGLPCLILKDGVTTEYWYRNGITNTDLIEKSAGERPDYIEVIVGSADASSLGIDPGSTTIINPDFVGIKPHLLLNNVNVYSIDPGNGEMYFTKPKSSDTMTLSTKIYAGQIIKIIF